MAEAGLSILVDVAVIIGLLIGVQVFVWGIRYVLALLLLATVGMVLWVIFVRLLPPGVNVAVAAAMVLLVAGYAMRPFVAAGLRLVTARVIRGLVRVGGSGSDAIGHGHRPLRLDGVGRKRFDTEMLSTSPDLCIAGVRLGDLKVVARKRCAYLFVTSDEIQIWRRGGLLMRRVASLDLSEVQEMRRFDPVIGVNREIDGPADAAAYGRGGRVAMARRWADSFEEGWYFSLGGQMNLWFSSWRWQ